MEKTDDSVHIYLKNKQDLGYVNKLSSHEKYIILMNETLQMDNRDLRSQLKESETKTDEQENEIDRNDVSTRYMKGMLKNFVELSKLEDKYKTIKDSVLVDNKNYLKQFKKDVTKQLRVFEFVSLLAVCLACQIMLLLLTVGICIGLEYTLINMHYPSNEKNEYTLKKLNVEIKTIKDSQDFIGDHIDNI
jgi:predicted nuclease with TOPRIM domain